MGTRDCPLTGRSTLASDRPVLGRLRKFRELARRLIRLLARRFLSGYFSPIRCRSASGHLFNADPVEDRRTPFPPLSGDTSRLPPHGTALQNFESVRARALMLRCIG